MTDIISTGDMFSLQLDRGNPRDQRVICVLFMFALWTCIPFLIRICASLIGFVVVYHLFSTYGAQKKGERVWPTLEYQGWHVHHWCFCLVVLLATLLYTRSVHPLLLGACFGGIAHGIQFSDWKEFKTQQALSK